MKEPQGEAAQAQRVTTKNPKKVEAGKRLAAHNRKKIEEQRKELCDPGPTGPIRAVIVLGVIGGLGYYIYRTKKGGGEVKDSPTMRNPTVSNNQALRR